MNHFSRIYVFLTFVLLLPVAVLGGDFLGIKGEDHSSVGIYIKDIATDTMVVELNPDRGLVPASITKLYTAASAMSLLPRNFRYETKVYLSGSSKGNGVWDGNIVIKASGDPTLESEHFKSNQGFIARIVESLKSRNITKVEGDIVLIRVDESHQYPEGPLDTWNISDVCWAYGCGVFDFNWCDNYFGIFPATGRTTSPVPGLSYTVWDKPWSTGLSMYRGIYSDSLIITGKQYTTDRKARINTSMPYPFDVFRAKLKDRLQSNGIAVSGKKKTSQERTLLFTHNSPVLDEILQSLMFRSDNMFAEGVLKILGDRYGDRDASLKAESKLWDGRGLEVDYQRIIDGSGLSRGNSISPRFLGDVLEWMARSDMKQRYVSLFPVSGKDGTMKSYLADTPLKGRAAFKTGSVNGVQCYAGYLKDADGEPTHVVVVMVNNFYCTRTELKKSIGQMLQKYLNPCLN